MNVRKVLAGSLAALTAGATLAFGIYAAGLGDYVVKNGVVSMPIIAVGDQAAVSDVVSAVDVGVALAGYATQKQAVGTGTIVSVSDGTLLSSDLNKTYINATFSSVKDTLTNMQLPTLLASQTFTDKNATTITYTQQIKPGSNSVQYGIPTGSTDASLYTTFGGAPNNYSVVFYFLGGLDTAAVDTNYGLNLLGNQYTFGATTPTGHFLELFTSAGATTVTLSGAGDEKTVTVDGTEYTIKLTGWSAGSTNDGDEVAYLLINGAATSPPGWVESTYYTLPGTTTKVYVKSVDIVYTGAQEATAQVQLFIGANKLEFIHGSNVEKNDIVLPNVYAYMSNSSGKINSLTVTIGPDIDTYMTDGGTFTDPVFGFKWALNDMTPGLKSSSRDLVRVDEDGYKVKLTFTNKDGTQYAIPVAYYDNNAFERTVDGTYDFRITEGNLSNPAANNITLSDYFVVTDAANKASYIYKFITRGAQTSTSPGYVSLQDVATGTTQKVYLTDPYLRIGASKFKVANLSADLSTIIVDLDGDGDFDNSTVNIFTKGEALIDLSNLTNDNVVVAISEMPLYTLSGSNEPTNRTITITASYASNDMNFALGSIPGTTPVSIPGTYLIKAVTQYGTYIERDTNADTNAVYLPGNRPAYANVAVGSNPVISSAGGSTQVDVAVKITTPVAKLASEVDTSALTRDLVLVGGPCANNLVKTLLNTAWNVTDSCSSWSTQVTGDGIIKEITNAFNSGKTALIVAGTNAADTRAMAAKVMQGITAYPA